MKHTILLLTSLGSLSMGCAQLDQMRGFPQNESVAAAKMVATQPAKTVVKPDTVKDTSAQPVRPVDFTSIEPTDPNNVDPPLSSLLRSDEMVKEIEGLDQRLVRSLADASALQSPSDEMVSTEPGGFTLESLEQLALSNHPAISAARSGESVASGLRYQVGRIANPTVGYSGQQLADAGTAQDLAYVNQQIVRGRKLQLNQEVLGHTLNAQRWETWTQQQRVLTDVQLRFYEALAAQMLVDTTRRFREVAKKGVDVAQVRLNAGEGTRIDVLQSQTLLSQTELAIQQRQAVLRGTLRDLAAVVGMPDLDVPRVDGELIDAIQTKPQITYQEILARSPELSAARAVVCEKRSLLERQRVQPKPNLNAQIAAGHDNGTGSGMLNVTLGAPIPVWNRNRGNVSAALADYRRAVQNVNRIEADIKSRFARTT